MVVMLKSTVLKVVGFRKRTRAKMFEDLRIGDMVLLSIPVKEVGSGNRGTYAPYITATNLITGYTAEFTFNRLPQILDRFEFEEEDDYFGQIR